jgi:hypothetical protein
LFSGVLHASIALGEAHASILVPGHEISIKPKGIELPRKSDKRSANMMQIAENSGTFSTIYQYSYIFI